MQIVRNVKIAVWMTVMTTLLLGLVYPLAVTAIAQVLFRDQANGQLIERDGVVIGSRIIGQHFVAAGYFHGRPSAAGAGYDASASGGSNLGPTSRALIDRIRGDVKKLQAENADVPIPSDLVTASGSGLDPHLSPASAAFQVPRIAKERHVSAVHVQRLVDSMTEPRQFGLLGEPVVNVLMLNLELDRRWP